MKSLVLYLLLAPLSLLAQTDADTKLISKTKWKVQKVAKGLVWKSFHFNKKELFGSNQHINILCTKLKNKHLRFGLMSVDDSLIASKKNGNQRLLTTSKLAEMYQTIAAINGTFFDTKKGGSVDFIKINGKVLDTTQAPKGKRAEHQLAAIAIDKNKVEILKGEDTSNWDKTLAFDNMMVTGPLLIFDGQVQALKKAALNDNRHPRTCACITQKRELLWITLDGRTPEAQGMNLHELSFFCLQLGCKSAINLDGGGSTTMVINGLADDGVVNMPCDNKKFDHFGERPVSNALGIWLKK